MLCNYLNMQKGIIFKILFNKVKIRRYSYSPYKPCIGRKYRLLPKLYRPFVVLINSNLCSNYLLEKNKIRFINQLFRWFYKSR